jgi:hypothetical protein
MEAAGPAPRVYDPSGPQAMKLIRELLLRDDVAHLAIDKPGFKLELTR